MSARERLVEWYVSADEWHIDKEGIDPAHAEKMGRIVVRLQTLETLLRLRLYNAAEEAGAHPSAGLGALHLLKVGDSVHVADDDHFVSYDQLGRLVAKFAASFPTAKLDSVRLLVLRDAVAHGRVLPMRRGDEHFLKLVKFGKIEPGTIDGHLHNTAAVEFAAELTSSWFDETSSFLDREIERVRRAPGAAPTAKVSGRT